MAKAMIGPGQKRVMLTVEEESYREMQRVAKALGMPRSVVSAVCDQAIKQNLELWKNILKQGKFTVSDLLKQASQLTMEELNGDKGREAATGSKARVKHSDKPGGQKKTR